MLRRRFAIVGTAVVMVGFGAVPAGWADNTGPPKPQDTGNEGGANVCHYYPGASAETKTGDQHGTPGLNQGACNR
jgi:hypothetical protein